MLFAGSGLSAQAGLPTWHSFVKQLVALVRNEGSISLELSSSWEESMAQEDFSGVADAIVLTMWSNPQSRARLLAAIQAIVSFPSQSRLPEALTLAAVLPFSAVLTTNFDNLLHRAFALELHDFPVLTPQDGDHIKSLLSKSPAQFFLLHLYGQPSNETSFLLSRQQFQETLSRNLPYEEALGTILATRTLLFLGASLAGIEGYLSGLRLTTNNRKHYALIDVQGTAWRTRAESLRLRFNIEVIPYDPANDFSAFPRFLDELRMAVRDHGVAQAQTGPSLPPVQAVRLVNIGGFRDIHLTFDDLHTVLLGSNGVGKSTILRAIALAMCGEGYRVKSGQEDPRTRMLATGATAGRIEVTNTAGHVISAHLLRTSDGGLQVTCTPPRPLEAQATLYLACPSLRSNAGGASVDWEKAGPDRPVPADLAPILEGDLENRASDVKNWLLDLDYRMELEPHLKNLRDDYFHVLSRLAEGTTIGFERIDRAAKKVYVRTDDGVVPVEWVSQGMASLLCWIGILMRRLSEIHGPSIGYRDKSAVVLIDEIDAHMHPKWQRALLTTLRELFPGLQLIAATHSPLVISDLGAESVWLFHRDEDGVCATRPPVAPRTLRTEEILTGPIFGLDTVWGPETEKKRSELDELKGRIAAGDILDTVQQLRFEQISQDLGARLPATDEVAAVTRASRVIETAAKQSLDQMSDQQKTGLLSELRKQLLDQVTGTVVGRGETM